MGLLLLRWLLLLRLSPLRLLLLSLQLVAPILSIIADRKYLADCVLDRPRVSFSRYPLGNWNTTCPFIEWGDRLHCRNHRKPR